MSVRERIDVADLVDTGLELDARFDSRLITPGDLEAFFRLMRELVEATEQEIPRVTGKEVILVAEIRVSGGSVWAKLNIKTLKEMLSRIDQQAAATILAAIIGLWAVSDRTQPPPPPPPVELSSQCEEKAVEAFKQAKEVWEYTGKGYKATFKFKCGDTFMEATMESPDPKTKK